MWERIPSDVLPYFTLKNPKSGKFLTGNYPPNTLTIEGTATGSEKFKSSDLQKLGKFVFKTPIHTKTET